MCHAFFHLAFMSRNNFFSSKKFLFSVFGAFSYLLHLIQQFPLSSMMPNSISTLYGFSIPTSSFAFTIRLNIYFSEKTNLQVLQVGSLKMNQILILLKLLSAPHFVLPLPASHVALTIVSCFVSIC